jgi:Uroporphyrinogen-III decarboxylase
MNMKNWFSKQIEASEKKALPILSFPAVSLMGITVKELISSSDLQAKGMQKVAERVPSAACVSMMDLSVEAEAFGAAVRFSDDEVPTIIGTLITDEDDADTLTVPAVGAGRTGLYLDAIKKARELITDRPILAGVIGPFSLAGRLMDVSEALANCIAEPDMVHTAMRKTTAFLIEYINAYKAAGANGVVMAEPLTGILSPALAETFSEPYVRQIIEATQTDDFAVVYHNCGNNTIMMIDSILRVGAAAYHFGNAIDMLEMLAHIPGDVIAMGNIDPAGQLKSGTPASVYENTRNLMAACCPKYPNFIISSGCDIPPSAPWANIDAFFNAVRDYYAGA